MIGDWIEAFRLKFLPQGVLPVMLGTAVAWWDEGFVDLAFFALAFIGMALVQFGLTMLNDLVDFLQGTDRTRSSEKNPYSGGSGVLADRRIAPKDMFIVIVAFYLVAFFIGVYFTAKVGVEVLIIALAGFFISISYTVPPFRWAYRGLGEFAMLLGYGPTITLGAYFVQAEALSSRAFLAGLVPGMLMWAMILVNEIPDYEEDSRAGKKNLTVRLGREWSSELYTLSLAAIYVFIGFGVIFEVFPPWSLLALFSLPYAMRSVGYLQRYRDDKLRVAFANAEMVKAYSSTVLLFALGFIL